MADIAWTEWALSTFTAEQRAAAAAVLPPGEGPIRIPDPPPVVPASGLGIRVTGPGIPASGLDPNNPAGQAELFRLGYRYEGGRWIAPGATGTTVYPDGTVSTSGGGRIGLSSVPSASSVGGGSVLGVSVPSAPPVLLPSFVGGRIGRVVMPGGLRPASGGTERVRKFRVYPWNDVRR